MIGIWYFDPVTAKWLLWDEVRQAECEQRLAAIRNAGMTATIFKIARRRPTAPPRELGT